MNSEKITYPSRTSGQDILLAAIGFVLLSLGCSSLCILPIFPAIFTELTSEPNTGIMVLCASAIILPLLGLLGIGGLYTGLAPHQATLDAETIVHGQPIGRKSMRLAEIQSVSGNHELVARYVRGWTVTLTDRNGQKIQMVVHPPSHSHFDYRRILADLLPHLPAETKVDQSVQNFVESGQIP